MTIETAYIQVEGVNATAKPPFNKFQSGSLLVSEKTGMELGVKPNFKGDFWVTVSKNLGMRTFQKDNTYKVDIETNDKGYKSVVKNHTIEDNEPASTADWDQRDTGGKSVNNTTHKKEVDWDKKDRDKMIGGIGHDVAALLASRTSASELDEIAEEYKELMNMLVAIRDEIK